MSITGTKLYVPVITLSTEDNAKLLQQLKPSFKRTIIWNNISSKSNKTGEKSNIWINKLIQVFRE